MELWTNGKAHLVITGRGVARLGEQRAIHRFPAPPGLKRDQEPPDPTFVAVLDGEGTSVLLGRGDGAAYLELGGKEWKVRDAVAGQVPLALTALGGGRFAALVAVEGAGGRRRVTLAPATVDEEKGVALGAPVALPAAKRVKWWKDAIWEAAADVPWPEDDDDPDEDNPFEADQLAVEYPAGNFGKLRLRANAHGIVATSTYSGMVAVWDRETLAPKFAIRVPTQEEAEVYGVATAQGVLAVLTIEGRESAVLHAAPDASLIAKRHKMGRDVATGLGDPFVLGERAYVTQALGAAKTYAVSLPDLEAKATKDFEGDKNRILAHAVAFDGASGIVAYGEVGSGPHDWELSLVREGAKKLESEELIIPDFRPVTAVVGTNTVKRMEGPPNLGLAAHQKRWGANLGQPLTLEFDIPSNGGPSRGLFAEVSGDALKQGFLRPVELAIGDAKVAFEGAGGSYKATLPDVEIEAAFASLNPRTKQIVPQANTKLTAAIRFETVAKGTALLMIRIGPVATGSGRGSAMDGKTVFVT